MVSVKNGDCGEGEGCRQTIHTPGNVFNKYTRKMPLIKVLGREARPVTQEIMWNISFHPSHWPFLWLLESHVPAGSFQKVAHDAARLGKRRVAQEPWVSWCHFFVGCVAWFIVPLAPHRFAKAPVNSWAEKDGNVAHLSVLYKGTCAGSLLQKHSFPVRRWPESTRYLRVRETTKQSFLCYTNAAANRMKAGLLCLDGFLQPRLLE